MIPEEMRAIIQSLTDRTRRGEVNWVPAADLGLGSVEDDVVVSFPDFAVNVFRYSNEEVPGVSFAVLNSRGKQVERASAIASDEDYALLDELMSLATRQVSGADRIMEALRRALGQPGSLGIAKPKRLRDPDDELPF